MAAFALPHVPIPLSQTPPELAALQQEAANDLIFELSKADPWNHYYPNLRQGLNQLLAYPNHTAQTLRDGLGSVKRVLLRLINEDPGALATAKGFDEVGFQRFLGKLDSWHQQFTDLAQSQASTPS